MPGSSGREGRREGLLLDYRVGHPGSFLTEMLSPAGTLSLVPSSWPTSLWTLSLSWEALQSGGGAVGPASPRSLLNMEEGRRAGSEAAAVIQD